MKKSLTLLFVASAFLASTPALAINLDKIAGAVGSVASSDKGGGKNPVDEVVGKIEQRIDKVVGKVEERIEKYEKKIDSYENKLDQAEKAIDRVTAEINNFDKSQIDKYLKMAKIAVIGLILVFVSSLVLLVVIFVQTMRINAKLAKMKS
jgi:peptidoglycan hydrolase CwlO-like protein